MRTRSEILSDRLQAKALVNDLELEVLMDIRDLLIENRQIGKTELTVDSFVNKPEVKEETVIPMTINTTRKRK